MLARQLTIALNLCLTLAISVVLPAPVHAAVPTDEIGFTKYILGKLTVALPSAKFQIVKPLIIDIHFDTGAIAHAWLRRVWDFCASNSEPDCERAIGYMVAGVTPPSPQAEKVDHSMLRAVVRTEDWLANSQHSAGSKPGAKLVSAPFVGDLRILCAVDRPTSIGYLNEGDLAELGLSPDDAIALGIRNIAAGLQPLSEALKGTPGEATGNTYGDDYESSRILLHDDPELVGLSHAWGDRLIVAVPGTHAVLYADGRRKDALPAMHAAVQEEMARSERSISDTLLLWTKAGWEVIPPLRLTIPPAPAAGSTAPRRRV
jgi:hypothetical protein